MAASEPGIIRIQFFDSDIAPDCSIDIQGNKEVQGFEGLKRQGRVIEQATAFWGFQFRRLNGTVRRRYRVNPQVFKIYDRRGKLSACACCKYVSTQGCEAVSKPAVDLEIVATHRAFPVYKKRPGITNIIDVKFPQSDLDVAVGGRIDDVQMDIAQANAFQNRDLDVRCRPPG